MNVIFAVDALDTVRRVLSSKATALCMPYSVDLRDDSSRVVVREGRAFPMYSVGIFFQISWVVDNMASLISRASAYSADVAVQGGFSGFID